MNITLPSLPYAVDALEPHISRRTLSVHHGSHHAAYIARTRALISTLPESTQLEDVVRASARQNQALFNASAQAWNHAFLWYSMRPGGGGEPRGAIAGAIEASFGSHRIFCQQFVSSAGDQFGSGWAWLVLEGEQLRIVTSPNAETPLTTACLPLLTIDVWEHAYYLDYPQRRLDYIAAFLGHLVNWDFANQNLERYRFTRPSGAARRTASTSSAA